jgi:glycerol-3-phosphate dehydrogenase
MGWAVERYDVVVVGSGIVGLLVAYELSKRGVSVAVVDENLEPGFGVSKGHAGVMHVIQPPFSSLKSVLAVHGNRLYDRLVGELGVRYRRLKALLVASNAVQLAILPLLYIVLKLLYETRGFKVGIVGGRELRDVEPNVRGWAAIAVDGYAIVDSFDLIYKLFEACRSLGVIFHLGTRVTGVNVSQDRVDIETTRGSLKASFLVNAAGLNSDYIALQTGFKVRVEGRRGSMLVFDRLQVRNIVTPLVLLERRGTKGGGVIPTTWGHTIWGPNLASDISKGDRGVYHEDVAVLLRRFGGVIRVKGRIIKAYAGVRPTSDKGDFVIAYSPTSRRVVNVAGIDSPGLTAAPAIAVMVLDMLRKAGLKLGLKRRPPSLRGLSTRDKLVLGLSVQGDEGVIVCPCMSVSLADIARAVKWGARILDGVIFRTKLAMGFCQGQHCLGRALIEFSRMTGVEPRYVVKGGEGSWIVE